MPAQLTPDIDPDDVAASIHEVRSGTPEALRSSETRRNLLEAFGAILSDGEIDLNFETTDGETARVELGASPPRVFVPTWEFDQPVTELERKIYDLLIQQTLTVHEIGHVNYTDNAAFGRAKQSLPPEEQEAFHTVFNVLEDGAIEEQLRGAFNVADELAVTNANFRFSYNQNSRTYDMLAATQLAGLDLAVFDSGLLGDLLDPSGKPTFADTETRRTFQREVLPELAETTSDVLSEPDGERRAELILELWRTIREHFDSLTPPTQPPSPKGSVSTGGSGGASDAAPADALGDSPSAGDQSPETVGDTSSSSSESGAGTRSQSGDGSDRAASPANSDSSTDSEGEGESSVASRDGDRERPGGPWDDADRIPDSEPGTEGSDGLTDDDGEGGSVEPDSGEDARDSGSDDRGSDQGKEQTGGSGGAGGAGEDQSEEEDAHERARRAAARAESKVQGQEDLEEEIRDGYEEAAEEFVDVLDETARRKLTIETPTEPLGQESDRWRGIRRDGERLGRVFDQRLQNERRSSRRRQQPRGRLDTRSLSRLQRGDPRVFQSDESPDEKEYAMVLVLDRSGSMSSKIGIAERAIAMLAHALESVDVNVCIIDMYGSEPQVAKPFTVDIDIVPASVLTGKAGGGTPLASVLAVARERVTGAEYDPAMIVVTDGKPKDRAAYRAELQQTRFPVLGVYIDLNAQSRDRVLRRNEKDVALYDQRAIVIDEAELPRTLESMAREVMF